MSSRVKRIEVFRGLRCIEVYPTSGEEDPILEEVIGTMGRIQWQPWNRHYDLYLYMGVDIDGAVHLLAPIAHLSEESPAWYNKLADAIVPPKSTATFSMTDENKPSPSVIDIGPYGLGPKAKPRDVAEILLRVYGEAWCERLRESFVDLTWK